MAGGVWRDGLWPDAAGPGLAGKCSTRAIREGRPSSLRRRFTAARKASTFLRISSIFRAISLRLGAGCAEAVSQVGAPLAAILQSARTMQQIMNANVLERRLRINLKCLHQHTAIAALAHGT